MASTSTICNLLLISFFIALYTSSVGAATPAVCQYTPYPSICQASLPVSNSSATVYDYGRFSIRKSISAATKFSNLIDKYLSSSASLTTGAIRALEDCKYLAGVNVEFLSSTFQTVNTTQSVLSDIKSEDTQTMLSAILTNTETCIDGLQANAGSWSSKNGIVAPIKNDNKLYSVSLALFNKGWGGVGDGGAEKASSEYWWRRKSVGYQQYCGDGDNRKSQRRRWLDHLQFRNI
uniref:pectinesterase n=1 Tax=Lactuca sativa TaxID=4236 RepID=A0A9R1WTL1_LACSA|nr:hypothetical protein LSAT_V11C900456060 [Lactuca sativa]